MRNRLMWGIALAILLASLGYAQPFTYQGMLKQNGTPVTGTLSMTFKLYDALTGGSPIGSPITQDVSVQNGLFTVTLNFGNVWNGADRYLEIQVGSTVLSPRVKINPVPYASFAQRPWQTGGSNLFYTNGNVGIGTTSPFAPLSLGGGNANTKLALWQGNTAADVMGFGVGSGQFRIHLPNSSNRFSFLDAPNGSEIFTIFGNGNLKLADDRSISGLDQLVGFNDLRLYGDATGGPDLFIAANGNVGIGTNNPAARLSLGDGNANTKLALWQGSGANDLMGFGVGSGQFRIHLANSAYRFSFLDAPNGSEIVTIKGDGKVGIGTSSPGEQLRVQDSTFLGGDVLVGGNWFSVPAVTMQVVGGSYGQVYTLGPNLSQNVWLTRMPNNTSQGLVLIIDENGLARVSLYIRDGGGRVMAGEKNFCVPDPEDPTRDIWYASIEGPEVAMYVRGTAQLVNGRARIELPDHFRKLADEQSMTVQLTPLSPDTLGLCAARKGLNGIEVVELRNGRGNYAFDWEVKAVRKEYRDFRVYRSWDEVMSGGIDPTEAWEARLKSIQARQERQARQQAQNAKP